MFDDTGGPKRLLWQVGSSQDSDPSLALSGLSMNQMNAMTSGKK